MEKKRRRRKGSTSGVGWSLFRRWPAPDTAGQAGDLQVADLFSPDHTERFIPCMAFTSCQSSLVSGTSGSGSGSLLKAPCGEATTIGRGPHSSRNSTTWRPFLSARCWWVSWKRASGGQLGSVKDTCYLEDQGVCHQREVSIWVLNGLGKQLCHLIWVMCVARLG